MQDSCSYVWGPFTVVATHHEWDCGDGCCSSSGTTAEITDENGKVHYFGDEERDGHYALDDYAKLAFAEYLKQRDGKTQHEARRQQQEFSKKHYEQVDIQNQRLLRIVVVAYKFLLSILELPNVWGRSNTAKLRKATAACLIDFIRDEIPEHTIALNGCSHDALVIDVMKIDSNKKRI